MSDFDTKKTKKDRTAAIRARLGSNYGWAARGCLRIFENQTADEQASQTTKNHNNIGFTGADAYILSSFAKQLIAGRVLSEKQRKILFARMPKYAKQLEGVARNVHTDS